MPGDVLVGRRLALGALRTAVDSAVSGSGGVVVLAGDAEMGKTALAREAVAYAKTNGAIEAWGVCANGDGAPGYWPWIQVMRTLDADARDLLTDGYTARTVEGDLGHPDCVAAVEHAARLCASLGHEVVDADLPGLTPEVGDAISAMIFGATAWILRYWIRHVGREPGPDEIEPLTRALWEQGERVSAAQWLLAVEELQRFSRGIARFLTSIDVWMTPTMSTPPLPIGTMVSTADDPWHALEVSGQTVRYAGVVANLTGNPAMSVPLWWNDDGQPIGVHFLGRFGGEATLLRLAAQLEAAQPWADRLPPVHAHAAART